MVPVQSFAPQLWGQALGLAVYLMLFVAVFYYALKWLGLIRSPRPSRGAPPGPGQYLQVFVAATAALDPRLIAEEFCE